jgi:hypothetical protein
MPHGCPKPHASPPTLYKPQHWHAPHAQCSAAGAACCKAAQARHAVHVLAAAAAAMPAETGRTAHALGAVACSSSAAKHMLHPQKGCPAARRTHIPTRHNTHPVSNKQSWCFMGRQLWPEEEEHPLLASQQPAQSAAANQRSGVLHRTPASCPGSMQPEHDAGMHAVPRAAAALLLRPLAVSISSGGGRAARPQPRL